MNAHSAKKATNSDIERVLTEAARVRDEMTDLMILIGAGRCEHMPDPLQLTRRCLNMARLFGDAANHFLSRAELQTRL